MNRSTAASALRLLALAAVVAALPAVAHGDGEDGGGAMDMDGGDGAADYEPEPEVDLSRMSYFAYPEHKASIYAHIMLMVLGWAVVLPICKDSLKFAPTRIFPA